VTPTDKALKRCTPHHWLLDPIPINALKVGASCKKCGMRRRTKFFTREEDQRDPMLKPRQAWNDMGAHTRRDDL
jgi:hypothetical protein